MGLYFYINTSRNTRGVAPGPIPTGPPSRPFPPPHDLARTRVLCTRPKPHPQSRDPQPRPHVSPFCRVARTRAPCSHPLSPTPSPRDTQPHMTDTAPATKRTSSTPLSHPPIAAIAILLSLLISAHFSSGFRSLRKFPSDTRATCERVGTRSGALRCSAEAEGAVRKYDNGNRTYSLPLEY